MTADFTMLHLFRSYLVTLIKLSGAKFWLQLFLMSALSITEGFGLLLLLPLLELVGVSTSAHEPTGMTRLLQSGFSIVGLHPTIFSVLALYVAVVGVRTLLSRWQTITLNTVQNEFSARLRQQLYDAIVNTNWLFFSRNRISDFVHALSSQIDRVSLATQAFLSLLVDVFLGAAYLCFALYLAAPITIMVALCGIVLWLVLKEKTNAARAVGETISAASTSLHAAASEHLAGLKAARSYGAQQRNGEIFSRLADDLARANIAAARNQADVRRWFDLGFVVMLSVIVIILVDVLATPTASLLVVLFMFYRLIPRFSSIQRSYQFISNMLPAFAVVTDLQARCEAEAEAEPRRSETVAFRRSVRLEEVSFAYTRERHSRPAIEKLSISIPAGQTSAIVGPSGAGKSTVCDLVMGLIGPGEGRLLVDEVPLSPERIRSWRDQLGYVPQDSFLLHDTVRANLLWARPGATDQELLEALRLAAADRFVAALPQEMETVVGDRGVLLSGGERQRVALARALLRKPALLILDEASSSLDSENERRIQQAIELLHGHLTILIVTHRLSTVRDADVIYVLEQGHLVESGTWDELLAKEHGRFRALCSAQGIKPGSVPV